MLSPVLDAADAARHAARGRRGARVSESVRLYMVDLVRQTRARLPGAGRLEPAWVARPLLLSRGSGGAQRSRLRHPRGREGDRGAGAVTSPDAAARAVGATGLAPNGVVRDVLETVPTPPPEEARPAGDVKRTPKLVVYGVAAVVLFLLALVLGRPQLVGPGRTVRPRPRLGSVATPAGRRLGLARADRKRG